MKRNIASTAFGICDLLVAALYLYCVLALAPSRSMLFTTIALLVIGIVIAGGVGMILQTSVGHKLATISSLVLLTACLVLILLLLSSAAYMHGIYNGIGQAGAAIAILIAFLAIQMVGLLPALQLAHLRRLKRSEVNH